MTSARLALIDARLDRRSEIADLLNAHHHSTVPLASLSEFEEARHSLNLDLLIATVSTSHTGPVDFVRKIRNVHSIPLIIICDFDDILERVIILEAGCDDVLFEPIHPKELIARVRSVLRRARLEGDPFIG